MGLVVVVIIAALLVGRALGGSLDRLARLRLRWLPLLGAAAACQVVGWSASAPSVWRVLLALSAVLAAAFLAGNASVVGVPLATAGLVSNALVTALNGAMPVSLRAAAAAGVDLARLRGDVASGADPRHELLSDSTVLPWLADVVPVALPLRGEVASVGDLLVAAGLGLLVVAGMRGTAAGPATPEPARDAGDHAVPDEPRMDLPITVPPRTDPGGHVVVH